MAQGGNGALYTLGASSLLPLLGASGSATASCALLEAELELWTRDTALGQATIAHMHFIG